MRVAFCISGQPRTWEKCFSTWNMGKDIDVDIFFHLWDYNTEPNIVAVKANKTLSTIKVSQEEKNKIVETLKPKKYFFDSRLIDNTEKNEYVKEPLGWWCRSQFYSLWYCAQLKRQYEIENNFEYDLVFRFRTDLFFESVISIPDTVNPNTLYSSYNGWMNNVLRFMIGDTFYFSDSYTYDQVAEFFFALNYIDTYNVVQPNIACPPPEVALYPFIKSMGIKNISTHQHFKIMRTESYREILGELNPYEIV
jgi:hypothetical protein